jgi:peptidoglycan/LPS O-acetylase OafA/YrhL
MSAARAPNPAGHLDALTGIRGIAAWLVVFYHLRLSMTDLLPAAAIDILAKGYLAVDMFFMLSGFVIWYNYAGRIADGGWHASADFLWRRFARVWPLHGAILAAFMAFALLLAVTGRDTSDYPWHELPLHVLLLQNWGFTPALAWNHPAWSISTEMAAYLAFPALVPLLARAEASRLSLLLIAAGLIAAQTALYAANGHSTLGADISGLGLWRCLAEFTLGCVLCMLWRLTRGAPAAGLISAACLMVVGALAVSLDLPETAFVPAALFAGLLALAHDRGPIARLLGAKLPRYLGEISYSTYLAHFGLFIVFKLAFVDASLQMGWVSLAGFILLLLAVSAALYHGLEKPAQRWLGRRPPRLIPGRRAAAD